MKRIAIFLYGTISHLIFFSTFLYAIAFLGNLPWVPKTIDSAAEGSLALAIAVNTALLGLFAVQHSGMARPAFKRWWTKIVPQPAERSTYVLISSLLMIALFWLWRPLPGIVWSIENPTARGVVHGVYGVGWITILVSTFLINHFDLFGLRQVYLHLRGRDSTPLSFSTPILYRFVRHPLYVGWLIAFWAAPTMSVTRLVFAIANTLYILVAIRFEEHDLAAEHGSRYQDYQRDVPMLIPNLTGKKRQGNVSHSTTIPNAS
jgi:protein-S-isoprenylcysteine O-methyltransferase Ste14